MVEYDANSILDSTKKTLGVPPEYTAFDPDIILHINSIMLVLSQLGIGPSEGFAIEDKSNVWSELLGTHKNYNAVKTYVYLRVRLLFDPPATSFAVEAMNRQITELEWRINVEREEVDHPWTDQTTLSSPTTV